jgi:hypothetical protein
VNPTDMTRYVAPYVQVMHAIHLLYATSPRHRDEEERTAGISHRYDKHGNRLPLELHGCGCSLCARQQRMSHNFWEAR